MRVGRSQPIVARGHTAAAVSRRKGDLAACRRAYSLLWISDCQASCIEVAGRGTRLGFAFSPRCGCTMRVHVEEYAVV